MLYVIMNFTFYFSIEFSIAFTAYHVFAIDVICDFHIHVVQAFVLKPLKPGIVKTLTT